MMMFTAGDGCQCLFSLWDKKINAFISDEFMVAVTGQGMPDDISLMDKMHTLFTDLTQTDFESLFLVCRIYRVGKLNADNDMKGSGMMAMGNAASPVTDERQVYKRHFGVSVLNLTDLKVHQSLIGEERKPDNMPIYQPKGGYDSNFSTLYESIANGRTDEYEVVPRSNGIAIGMSMFDGESSACLSKEAKLEGVHVTMRRHMRDVIETGENRNDLYVTLSGGDFSQDSKKTAKNIEVKVQALMDTGSPIECLVRGSGAQSLIGSNYRSTVYYHTNSPPYNETIKLLIPPEPDKFERSHLLFTFYHASGSKPRAPFAFSFLELADSETGASIKDGEHTVMCYKLLENMAKNNMIVPKYLQQKAKLQVRTFRSGLSKLDENFRVHTTMCSTKKTQNGTLHDLMNWRQLEPKQLEIVIQSCLGKLPGSIGLQQNEIFKFLREILDALCAIFSEKRANLKAVLPVFHLFVHILELFTKSHFEMYTPILTTYIVENFKNDKLHKVLLQCLDHYLKWVDEANSKTTSPDDVKIFKNAMSGFNFILWFINVSRQQDPNANPDAFKAALLELMTRVNKLMTLNEEKMMTNAIKIVRGKTLKHFPSVVDHLLEIFSPIEVGVIVAGYFDAVPKSELSGSFNFDKLTLVQHIADSAVFKDKVARSQTLPAIVKTLQQFLNNEVSDGNLTSKEKEKIKSEENWSIKALLSMLKVIQEANDKQAMNEIIPLLSCLIMQLNKMLDVTHHEFYDEKIVDTATALLTMVYLMDDAQFSSYLMSNLHEMGKKERMQSMLECFHRLIKLNTVVFPHIWLVVQVFMTEVTVKLLEWSNVYMVGEFLEQKEIMDESGSSTNGGDLWDVFYDISMKIIMMDLLSNENESSSNDTRREILSFNNYGMDLRVHVVSLLEQNWSTLNNVSKLLLADNMVQNLLSNIGCKVPEISIMCKEIYFDLLKCEFMETSDFKKVRDHTISSVHSIVTEQHHDHGGGGGMEDPMKLNEANKSNPLFLFFENDLDGKFREDNVLNNDECLKFLEETKQLFQLLVALAQYPKNHAHEHERCFAFNQLMDYLKQMKREESYTRYAHRMSAELKSLGLNIEAGKALLLHSKLLKFADYEQDTLLDEFKVDSVLIYPQQTETKRKEQIMLAAMALFDEASFFEGSIELCDELAKHYANNVYKYRDVSQMMKKMAHYYEQIEETDRFYPSIFRVGYYGAYGREFKNKDFVYRGDVLESIGDFTTRIKLKFPRATMLPVKVDPDSSHFDNQTEQFLQISKVSAGNTVSEDQAIMDVDQSEMMDGQGKCTANMPPFVRSYRSNNNVNVFWYTRPFRKRETKSKNEFLDLWVEKKFLKTEEVMPCCQRRSVVVAKSTLLKNPLENACVEIEKKNAELREKFEKMEGLADGSADNSYTMAINGVVDAAVNGGLNNYVTFIDGTYKTENPEIYDDVMSNEIKRKAPRRLIVALQEQMVLLTWGVGVHKSKCSESLLPLHEHIEMMYAKLKVSVEEMIAKAPRE